jgi:predicted enzyme related to lactoylglutathione lyase
MSINQGRFVWYDVMTTDTRAAEAFYRKVCGWTTQDSGMSDRSYTLVSAGPTMVGGIMPIPEAAKAMGARPGWLGYVGVDDVDAYAAKVKAAGGAVHRGPEDIPGIGRFAAVADPQGAMFILFRGSSDAAPTAAPPNTPGHIGWHELHTTDDVAALKFYSDLFGWTQTEAMDMGPMGLYRLFATGGEAVGGIMKKPPEVPMPAWLYYFNVDAIDAASARVTEAGGKVLMGPAEVPGPMWIVQCMDPQGAAFALVGSKR